MNIRALLFLDPLPLVLAQFFYGQMYQNYFFTPLLVENVSFISVLSKFTFQLNDNKIYN